MSTLILVESLFWKNVPEILMFQKEINQNIPGRNFIFFPTRMNMVNYITRYGRFLMVTKYPV